MQDIYRDLEMAMNRALEYLKNELSSLRAGRAHPGILDRIFVNYYGTETPLNQLASVSAPEARLIVIQPYDKNSIPDIEKAILTSDLSLSPNNDGKVIRLNLPMLTEENRRNLTRVVKKDGEECKVVLRNERRSAIDVVKKREKDSEIREDDAIRAQDEIQKIVDKAVAEVDKIVEAKIEEIMEV